MHLNFLLAAFSAVVTAEKPVTVDFGPDGEGGYPAFEVKEVEGATEAGLHVVYATHPDGLGPKGDFWRETSARYLGPDVDLPILPANVDRYDDFSVKAGGTYRAPLCQGLVRYAKLSTATKGAKISVENFRLQNDGVHATEEPTGSFVCSDERLNGVWKSSVRTCQLAAIPAREKPLHVACAWTNVVLGPTHAYVSDGAKRDRLVWSGDLWWADLNYYYAFDPQIPYLKGSILMLAENQTPEGYVQACPYPERHGGLKSGEWGPFESDEFAAWLIPVVHNYRLYTGDEETVRRVLPALKRLMAYLESHCRADGLFEQRPETSKCGGSLRFGAKSTEHRSYFDLLLQACRRDMAELTGDPVYAARAAAAAPAVKKAHALVDGTFGFSEETRISYPEATALNYALGDADGRAYPAALRKQIWHAKFEAVLVRALFEGGFADEALDEIAGHNWFKVIEPDWKGMRTTYECMYLSTKGWGDEAHPDTSIAGILSRYVLGVVPTKPGWAEFKFDPRPPKSVTWAKGAVPTPKGLLRVEWKRDGGRIVEKLSVPEGLVRR
ncbi:MAG: hypothetical protein MJ138_07765 [Kiritimatiellae bacterium]|nr:hypothetical protein [Kiritimatiellia bacterium]